MRGAFADPQTIQGTNVKHGVNVWRAADQSFANNTAALFTFDTETEDTDTYVTVPGTNITIPANLGGLYVITDTTFFAANATGQRRAAILLNGVEIAGQTYECATFAGIATQVPLSTIAELEAGDVITIQGMQSSGIALNGRTFAQAYRIAA